MKKISTLTLTLLAAVTINAQEVATVTFEAATTADDGTAQGCSYEENGYVFDNYYDAAQWYNSGYTVSNCTDRNTPGFMNQYAVDARSGADGSKNFVVYNPCYYTNCYIHRSDNKDFKPEEMAVALTSYVSIAMQDGDSYSKKFGKGDFYTMTIKGLDASCMEIKSMDVELVKYPHIWMPWATIDLSELGSVNKLLISFSSSDNGQWGMNTPAYIAIDNFKAQSGIATGIKNASADFGNDEISNINGIRVNTMNRPGLYVKNGKKIIVK